MSQKTIESFIQKLIEEGHRNYASELRYIIAMSRKRKDAEIAFTNIAITLLVHIIKFISLPKSTNNNKWKREIKGYLSKFDIRNKSPRNRPWLPIEFIKKDLNDVLSNSNFLHVLEQELEEYSNQDRKKIKTFAENNKTLKALGVKMFYEHNNLNISINEKVL